MNISHQFAATEALVGAIRVSMYGVPVAIPAITEHDALSRATAGLALEYPRAAVTPNSALEQDAPIAWISQVLAEAIEEPPDHWL